MINKQLQVCVAFIKFLSRQHRNDNDAQTIKLNKNLHSNCVQNQFSSLQLNMMRFEKKTKKKNI